MADAAKPSPVPLAVGMNYVKKKKKPSKEKEKRSDKSAKPNAADERHGSARRRGDKKKDNLEITTEIETNVRIGQYQMLEPIGKGGFGVVYRGLNLKTGATVAIKRVALHGIPKEELEGIETEIKLLKNLIHPNIVKYIDAIRSDDYLNIILEHVENGALSHLLSHLLKHGNVEENLVAVYTFQILEGLKYLHQQGVIHRDIKGANILLTKDGIVKLADFGVATKLNESRKSDSVVGTPYWMAPEIIEMTGQQSSACDIWSVGCTVVELLTGKPPYFDLQQMPALFRIVQDEHPPLPDNISPGLEDFLMQCFQKDPLRRISAQGLLKHPWLKKALENRSKEPAVPVPVPAALSPAKKSAGSRSTLSFQEPAKPQQYASNIDDLDMMDDDDDVVLGGPTPKGPPVRSSSSNNNIAPARARSASAFTREVNAVGRGSFDGDSSDLAAVMEKPSKASRKKAYTEEPEAGDDLGELEDQELDPDKLDVKKKKIWDEVQEADGDDDIFENMEFDEADARTEHDQKVEKSFLRVINNLSPKNEEDTIITACNRLQEMMKESPDNVKSLMTKYAVIPIMEMLEVPNPNIIVAVLKLVNLVIGHDQKFQQNMSLVGLIPAIVKFASPGFPSHIRLEAANFVRHFCYASDFTRKMFVACGGLPVLVGFLQEPYSESKTLVFNAVDCIRHVFDITTNPKNDFCRLFCKYGLLPPLVRALQNVNADKDHPDAAEYTIKIADIVQLFSQGDPVVKTYLAKPGVIEGMIRTLNSLPHDVLNHVLKSIRAISMDPNTLDLLEAANAIPALVPFLASPYPDIQNQVLLSMYYLCTIKSSRQEQAARSGIIPHLQRFIRGNHPLKQFALPIIFQLAKTSKRTRLELKKYNGVSFFLDLLEDYYWRTYALDALALWLNDDTRRVEYILTSTTNINKLVTVLKLTKKSAQFEKLLVAFDKLVKDSGAVNRALGRSSMFIDELVQRLTLHADSNTIKKSLLSILKQIYDAHSNKDDFLIRHNLVPVLEELSKDKNAVIISPLASGLLTQITKGTVEDEMKQ